MKQSFKGLALNSKMGVDSVNIISQLARAVQLDDISRLCVTMPCQVGVYAISRPLSSQFIPSPGVLCVLLVFSRR